ncbi:MAG: N-acetyltransferase [Elusimicrobia bacterium]|nr:N-acetyltransferase [Elusimicrobiota bacterium]
MPAGRPDLTVSEVSDAAGLRDFIEFPYAHYRGDPCWVPPLRNSVRKQLSEHPFNRYARSRYFLARREGVVVGRIAAVLNPRYNEVHAVSAGFFGFFESEDDPRTARALLEAASAALSGMGAKTMLGPASPSSNAEFGLLVSGFDRMPSVIMPYHRPYYARLLESFGLAKAKDLLAYEMRQESLNHATLKLFEKIAARHAKVTIRELDMRRFASELDVVVKLYNEAWEKNWGFCPMTEDELRFEAAELKDVIDPRVALFAEVEGKPVAFSLSIPDINPALKAAGGDLFPLGFLRFLWAKRGIRKLRTLLLGVASAHRGKGLDGVLVGETVRRGLAAGYDVAECSWVLEDNLKMRSAIERLGGVVTQTYRVYEKLL